VLINPNKINTARLRMSNLKRIAQPAIKTPEPEQSFADLTEGLQGSFLSGNL
jgi:hypothetical protein